MYVELHCHLNFSFHDGAPSIEELLLQARDLSYAALAITDHDNFCGAVRFAQSTPILSSTSDFGLGVTTCPRPCVEHLPLL